MPNRRSKPKPVSVDASASQTCALAQSILRKDLPVPTPQSLVSLTAFLKQRIFWGPTIGCSGDWFSLECLSAASFRYFLMGPMYCGIGLCFLAKEQGQRPSFDLMFKGFENFVDTLIPVLLYSLLLLVIVPLYMGGLIGGIFLIGSGEGIGIILGLCLIIFGLSALMIGSTYHELRLYVLKLSGRRVQT